MRNIGVIATVGVLCGLTLGLAGCERSELETGMPTAQGMKAIASLRTAEGGEVGRATATEVQGGLRLTVDGKALPPGTHGVHVHMTGRCDLPGFTTAGGHWNPTARKHGTMNPQGPHDGDLPNLIIDAGGRGAVAAVVPGATMAGLMDTDGSAFIVHADADDLMTDPSGNSGGRIACGVFQPG